MAAACLHLAAKMEEAPKGIKDIVAQVVRVRYGRDQQAFAKNATPVSGTCGRERDMCGCAGTGCQGHGGGVWRSTCGWWGGDRRGGDGVGLVKDHSMALTSPTLVAALQPSVLSPIYHCSHPASNPVPAQEELEKFKEAVLVAERAVLYTLGFHLNTSHPYTFLVSKVLHSHNTRHARVYAVFGLLQAELL